MPLHATCHPEDRYPCSCPCLCHCPYSSQHAYAAAWDSQGAPVSNTGPDGCPGVMLQVKQRLFWVRTKKSEAKKVKRFRKVAKLI